MFSIAKSASIGRTIAQFDSGRDSLAICRRWRKIVRRPQDKKAIEELPVFQYVADSSKKKPRVYAWGNVCTGALGNRKFLTRDDSRKRLEEYNRPYRVPMFNLMKVHDVAAGYGFSVVAATPPDGSNYSLFGTGLNTDSQLGYQQAEGQAFSVLIAYAPIQLPIFDGKSFVKKVACGRAHTVCLTSTGKLYSLGNNAFGQCGRPIIENEVYNCSRRIGVVEGIPEKIEKIVCGQDHTFFVSESGSVYSCGWGADGQTGLGHYDNVGMPSKVGGDIDGEKLVSLSSTADAVLACNEAGDVFGWGNTEYAQFNTVTDQTQLNVPRRLLLPKVGKVVQVAAAGTMCAVLNDKGQVYVWGFGILGKGPAVEHLRSPSQLPEPLFGCNEFNADVKVTSIYAGLNHFAAVTNKGDLYTWGKNRASCLGLGHFKDQFFPVKVCLPAFVRKVSLGVDHTVAYAVSLL